MKIISYNTIFKTSITLFILSLIIYFTNGFIFCISFLSGGLISIISNFIFTSIFFRKANNDSTKKIIFRLALGFLLKMTIVIILFTCIFLINKLLSFWVILGFIFTILLFLLANFLNFRKRK